MVCIHLSVPAQRLSSALDHDSNEPLLVLGLDAHGAHRIVIRVFGDW